jgi:superfamily I DNA/RNA helicase/RecB family exonuclease
MAVSTGRVETASRRRLPAGVAVRLAPPRPLPGRRVEVDPSQAELIGHRQGRGPVVVFGAPGSGKTSALVEAVAARIERDGVAPGSVLALAPTRIAADRLRNLLSARIAGTVQEPMARTPHSYAFGVLRRSRVLLGDPPPRLISGPEQDQVLAELLAGHLAGEGRAPAWPPTASEEIRELRGFRDELRELLMRAVERGLRPRDLARYGLERARPEWVAAAGVLAEYLDVTGLATPGAYDPAGIVDAAAGVLRSDPDLLETERQQRALVVVDDAHELTAASEQLLSLLAGGGRDLVLAGDPDAATQTFRGARPRALAEAAERFRTAEGRPARVVTLRTVHRHGPALRSVATRVSARIGAGGAAAHRAALSAREEDDPDSSVGVKVLGSPAREAAYVAQFLRRLHLDEAVPWRRMAVVVRSTRSTAPLRRALGAAGIPVAVPPTEVAVRDEPAVVPLRLALRVVLKPAELTAEVAAELLTGAIGKADTIAMRRLRQALRAEELAGGGVRASDELLVEALEGPGRLATLDSRLSEPARRVAHVLAHGREAAQAPGATPETVLWAIWSATGLGDHWRRIALGGGVSGARADRDLDAVMALFEAAARFTDRFPHADARVWLEHLEAQEIPADTLAEHAPTDDAVSLLTAQRAAGLEWDVVAVCGVQEGVWPDLRLRGSLLGGPDLAEVVDGRGETGAEGYLAQRRAVLDDELRLFHVAVSRARRHLLVTAVRSDDEMPSSLLDLVDPEGADQELRPLAEVPRTMTLPALVAELRAVTTDPDADPRRREAAARQLARLALAGVPGADPDDWYGLAPITVEGPLRHPRAVVKISPSQVELYDRCALRWLLETAGGRPASSSSQGLGSLIHELAEQEPDGDESRLAEMLEERFDRLGLGTGWVADAERARARQMVARLAQYVAQARANGRELVGVEQPVRIQVGRAEIRGVVDRLERDSEGRLVVVDLKTGKSGPSKAEVARHAQLGVYQVAVEEGGFTEAREPGQDKPEPGGAILAQLGTKTKSVGVQVQEALSRDPDPFWARNLLATVADGMAGDDFSAKANGMCRMCALRRSCPLQTEGRQVGTT